MANNTIEEISNISGGPKLFQLYVHKDQSITDDLIDRCRRSGFDGMCLTVDTCLLYTSPSPRDGCRSRMPSSA